MVKLLGKNWIIYLEQEYGFKGELPVCGVRGTRDLWNISTYLRRAHWRKSLSILQSSISMGQTSCCKHNFLNTSRASFPNSYCLNGDRWALLKGHDAEDPCRGPRARRHSETCVSPVHSVVCKEGEVLSKTGKSTSKPWWYCVYYYVSYSFWAFIYWVRNLFFPPKKYENFYEDVLDTLCLWYLAEATGLQ